MGIFHKPPTALAERLPTDGSTEPISTPHGVFPSQGDPELRSMQLQSTTETTPCPAALHTLHHSAHPTRCRALFIAGHISCMGARATTSDQPIAPSPNEQNIKPPTLIPLQSFFFFIDDDAQTARVSHRLAVRPRLLSWPSPVVGASSLVDRAYQSAMTVSCVSSSPRGPTGCKASKPRGQPFVPFRKAMRRSPFGRRPPTDAPTLRALPQHCSPMRTTLQRPQRPHKRQA